MSELAHEVTLCQDSCCECDLLGAVLMLPLRSTVICLTSRRSLGCTSSCSSRLFTLGSVMFFVLPRLGDIIFSKSSTHVVIYTPKRLHRLILIGRRLLCASSCFCSIALRRI